MASEINQESLQPGENQKTVTFGTENPSKFINSDLSSKSLPFFGICSQSHQKIDGIDFSPKEKPKEESIFVRSFFGEGDAGENSVVERQVDSSNVAQFGEDFEEYSVFSKMEELNHRPPAKMSNFSAKKSGVKGQKKSDLFVLLESTLKII